MEWLKVCAVVAAALAVIALAACNPSSLTFEDVDYSGPAPVYRSGTGGVVEDSAGLKGIVTRMREEADRADGPLVCDGKMISAHAWGFLVLMAEGRAVYTDRCILSPHAASSFGVVPLRAYTRSWVSLWPPAVRDWFLASSYTWRWMTYPEICGREAKQQWRCDAWLDELVPEYRRVD